MANTTIITGKAWEPKVKFASTGTCMAEVSVSFYDGKDKDGKAKYGSVLVKAWKDTAEIIGNDVAKGDNIQVIGRLTEEKWEKDGKTNRRLVLVADSVSKELRKQQNQVSSGFAAMGQDITDEDVPF